MTIDLENRQTFDLSAETYWKELCLSLEYQERMYREALGCTRMNVLEHSGDFATGMKRRLQFEKPIDAPAAVTKLFGKAVLLEEHSEFDPKAQRWTYRMVPGMMSDRLDIRGSIELTARNGHVEQVSKNSVTCKIFGLGGIIEHFIAKSTQEGNADKASFTRRYISEKGLR